MSRRSHLLGVVVFVLLQGCSQRALREWQLSDHSQEPGTPPGPPPVPEPGPEDNDPAIAVAALWNVQCAQCHGPTGHGDGRGLMGQRPLDFTTPFFQEGRTDAMIEAVIRGGRGTMPSFATQISPEGIRGLVTHIRGLGRAAAVPSAQDAPSPAEPTAPPAHAH